MVADSADVRRCGLELLVTAAGLLPDAAGAAVVARDALASMDPEERTRVAVFIVLAALDRPDLPGWIAGLRVRVGAANERDALERMWVES